MDSLLVTSHAPPLEEHSYALWRSDDSAVIQAPLSADPSVLRNLRDTVARVRPMALAVARALDSADSLALFGAAIRNERACRGRVRDSLATDLLGSALIVEAMAGDQAAQLCVDFMRRERGLAEITWPIVASRRMPAPKDGAVLPTPLTLRQPHNARRRKAARPSRFPRDRKDHV